MTVALESLRLAFSSLRANPLRAVLTILGIVIGIAAVVALTSIGSGSTRAVERRFNAFGTDTITVEASSLSSNATALTASDLAAIKATAGVKTTVYSCWKTFCRPRTGELGAWGRCAGHEEVALCECVRWWYTVSD